VQRIALSLGLLLGLIVLPLTGGWTHAAAAEVKTAALAPANEDLPVETVHLAVGKAELVRLPVEVRDVLVANPDTADVVIKTPRLIYLVGREVGSTNAFFLGADGEELLRLEVQVEVDTVSVKDTISRLLPDTDIDVTAVNADLFLTGTVRSADVSDNAAQIATRFVEGAANVVNLLTIIEDQQVLLQVRVAEISRNVLKELGFDVTANITSGEFAATFGTASTLTNTPFLNSLLTFTPNAGDRLTLAINALEQNGLIKTLAEPNLTTISGEPATFLAGGEFPIPVSADDGQIAISLEPFGVALNFTPVVLNSGRISLRIFTEVSALSNDGAIRLEGIQVPSLTVRRAETTVELPTGGSLVIAGLLQDNMASSLSGVPGLQNLPILGPFFRSSTLDRTETELIVAVTAFLVKPIEREEMVLPTDGITAPSDYEFYFVGRLQGMYAKEAEGLKTAELKGPIGYIVE